ncbi:hypothetical protein F972_02081 [Acinetobacter sp. CIP 102529]|uniref:hypothetical protein n=1 Tax=Acinetobacter sp. CIP 102529 TaxID=1144668 RepID=UPI0002CE8A42|nr:hypothetical protein [Acinetobacter sp. CIP 102529]ENU88517.1 hypothetical protein F972_02081 [Acinetobacter sp. CIP 102529]
MNNFENKKVSIPLAIGIFVIPIIFAWFTLKKGYSNTARLVSFGWLLLGVLVFVMLPTPDQPLVQNKPEQTVTEVKPKDEKAADVEPKPEENVQEKEFETIRGYNKAILAVRNHSNNVLEIDLPATEVAFTDLDYIDHTSRTTRDILIKILKNPPTQQFSAIRFVVFADLTDQYNNKKNEPIFQLTYDYAEIKKINIDADYVDHRLFLNFATFGLRSPVAHEMFEGWCGKGDNAERSGRFCQ